MEDKILEILMKIGSFKGWDEHGYSSQFNIKDAAKEIAALIESIQQDKIIKQLSGEPIPDVQTITSTDYQQLDGDYDIHVPLKMKDGKRYKLVPVEQLKQIDFTTYCSKCNRIMAKKQVISLVCMNPECENYIKQQMK